MAGPYDVCQVPTPKLMLVPSCWAIIRSGHSPQRWGMEPDLSFPCLSQTWAPSSHPRMAESLSFLSTRWLVAGVRTAPFLLDLEPSLAPHLPSRGATR